MGIGQVGVAGVDQYSRIVKGERAIRSAGRIESLEGAGVADCGIW